MGRRTGSDSGLTLILRVVSVRHTSGRGEITEKAYHIVAWYAHHLTGTAMEEPARERRGCNEGDVIREKWERTGRARVRCGPCAVE